MLKEFSNMVSSKQSSQVLYEGKRPTLTEIILLFDIFNKWQNNQQIV